METIVRSSYTVRTMAPTSSARDKHSRWLHYGGALQLGGQGHDDVPSEDVAPPLSGPPIDRKRIPGHLRRRARHGQDLRPHCLPTVRRA